MEQAPSFFDWDRQFKKKPKKIGSIRTNVKNVNSLGMPVEDFRRFLMKWESQNLT